MKPEIFPDHEAMSRAATNWLARELKRKPDSLFCLATGGTPTRTYDLLAEKRGARPELFGKLRVLKLDEWGGLAMDDPATCEANAIVPLTFENPMLKVFTFNTLVPVPKVIMPVPPFDPFEWPTFMVVATMVLAVFDKRTVPAAV